MASTTHNLLKPRTAFKPMSYDWAFEAYQQQNKIHWLPEEIPLGTDVTDWNTKLTEAERHLLTQLFRFFTQGDIDVAGAYIDLFMPTFKAPEVRMMMASFANMEAVHINAYSLLIDTVGMPEVEYLAFTKYKAMRDKHEYLEEFSCATKKEIAKSIAVVSAFTEGLQLFSSFAILLNFTRFGKMKGMGQIVQWSVRDESLHVESMIKLFRTFIEENPHLWTDRLKRDLYEICETMVDLEDHFIDLCFEQGGIEGLMPDEVKQYIRYIADRRLIALGLKGKYKVKDNPLPWLEAMLAGVEHSNFFEQRSTAYAKGAIQGDWTRDVWGTVAANADVNKGAVNER